MSSSGLLPEAIKKVGKPAKEIKLAHVMTAAKGVKDREYIDRTKKLFGGLDIKFKDVDIEGKNEKELHEMLDDMDVVFVNGGNTFYLLKAIRESGFDKVIRDLIDKGVVYIGASAGSYVACPTIETSKWESSPKDKHDECGLTDLTAMNLVPFIMYVHYTDDQEEFLKEKIKTANHPVKILNDDQALYIEDDEVTLIGKGEEIKL